MDAEKEVQKDKYDALQQEFLKDKDEPIRLGKGNENLKKAVDHLKQDYDKLVSDTKTVEAQLEKEALIKQQFDAQKDKLKKDMDDRQIRIKEIETIIKRLKEHCHQINEENLRGAGESVSIENEIKILGEGKKKTQEMINHLNKRYEDEKKIFKKLEYDENNLQNNLKEIDTQIQTTNKFLEEKKKENEQLQGHKKNLEEEQQIFVGQLVKKGLEEKNMAAKIMKLKSDITSHER